MNEIRECKPGSRYNHSHHPEAQVIAQGIAAFHRICDVYWRQGLPLPVALQQGKWIAAITMVGTFPIFYRVHVTPALLNDIQASAYPIQPTIVQRFAPPIPLILRCCGMQPLNNRRQILQYFEAFKNHIVSFKPSSSSRPSHLVPYRRIKGY